jgi:hypothetical protein
MPVTLCLNLTPGEPREAVKHLLASRETVVAVPSRHVVDRVEPDAEDEAVLAIWIDGAIERARPVDVRFEVRPSGDRPGPRSRRVGRLVWLGTDVEVYGTYLGPVSDEN